MNNDHSLRTYNSIVCCELGSSSNSFLLYIFLSAHDTSWRLMALESVWFAQSAHNSKLNSAPATARTFLRKVKMLMYLKWDATKERERKEPRIKYSANGGKITGNAAGPAAEKRDSDARYSSTGNFRPSECGKNLSMFIQLDTVASGQTNSHRNKKGRTKKYKQLLHIYATTLKIPITKNDLMMFKRY